MFSFWRIIKKQFFSFSWSWKIVWKIFKVFYNIIYIKVIFKLQIPLCVLIHTFSFLWLYREHYTGILERDKATIYIGSPLSHLIKVTWASKELTVTIKSVSKLAGKAIIAKLIFSFFLFLPSMSISIFFCDYISL